MLRYVFSIVLLICGGALAEEPLSIEQKEVWAGEVAYWEYVSNHDVDRFLTLWDERFIGWPCGAPMPENNDDLRLAAEDWFNDIARDGNETTIEPEAVIVDLEFAITYLAATTTSTNEAGDKVKDMIKITHTWKRSDQGWKIIGGMCGPLMR